jgi:Cu2+-exporting ATPase
MMLLIAMAISVAWGSSMASSLGWFDLEFWWELAGARHDHAARPLAGDEGDRSSARRAGALAALLPDEAEARRG